MPGYPGRPMMPPAPMGGPPVGGAPGLGGGMPPGLDGTGAPNPVRDRIAGVMAGPIPQALANNYTPPPAPFGQQLPGMGPQQMGQPPVGPTPGPPTGGLPGAPSGMGGGVSTMPGLGAGTIQPPMGMPGSMPGGLPPGALPPVGGAMGQRPPPPGTY